MKNLVSVFNMVEALVFLKGMASGNLVEAHMIVNWY